MKKENSWKAKLRLHIENRMSKPVSLDDSNYLEDLHLSGELSGEITHIGK